MEESLKYSQFVQQIVNSMKEITLKNPSMKAGHHMQAYADLLILFAIACGISKEIVLEKFSDQLNNSRVNDFKELIDKLRTDMEKE